MSTVLLQHNTTSASTITTLSDSQLTVFLVVVVFLKDKP